MLSLALGLGEESDLCQQVVSWPLRHLSGSICSSRELLVLPTELPAEEAGSAGGQCLQSLSLLHALGENGDLAPPEMAPTHKRIAQ